MNPKIAIIVTAAGKGLRFGEPNGKQFVRIHGKPLVIHACEALIHALDYEEFFITIEPTKIDALQNLLTEFHLPDHIQIVAGGETRYDSVKNAFMNIQRSQTVFIHDGARPHLSDELIQRLLQYSDQYPAIIPGIPLTDTVKWVDENHFVQQTPPRDLLYAVQTPQVFQVEILRKAYEIVPSSPITDEASLVENAGIPVKVIEGDSKNIKVTYPEDLKLLEMYLG